MSPGELIFHFLNTVVLTALVASGVLWRYRVDVLAGMGSSSGQALGIPAVNFGHGDPGKAHAIDEFCPMVDVEACVDALQRWLSARA